MNKNSNTSSSSNNIVNAITNTASSVAKAASDIVNAVAQNASTQPTSTGSKTTVTTSDQVKRTATNVVDTVTDVVTKISKDLSFIAKSTKDKDIQTSASTASTVKQVTSLISQSFMNALLGKGDSGTIFGGVSKTFNGSLAGVGKTSEGVSSGGMYIKAINTPAYLHQNRSNIWPTNILNTSLVSSKFNGNNTIISISGAISALKGSANSNLVTTIKEPKNRYTGDVEECKFYSEGGINYYRDLFGNI